MIARYFNNIFQKAYIKLSCFLKHNIGAIIKGGWLILLKKLYAIIMVILLIPVAFFLRILRPWIIVRFGELSCKRIGHFSSNIEVYLCEKNTGMHDSRIYDIFYYNAQICNYQLKKMWDRVLYVSHLAKYADKASRLLPGAKKHIVYVKPVDDRAGDRDICGLFSSMSPHIYFKPEEECFGKNEIKKLGITNNESFVCFHARDSAYLDTGIGHSIDTYCYRDSNISNYIAAAEELTRRGHYVIRMGSIVKETLNTINSKIIDYATNGRTDFLDIYLCAKCHFFISSGAGIYAIARIFKRPIIYVNQVPLEYALTSSANSLFIPKKLWLKKEKRFLSFEEILNSGVGRFLDSYQYVDAGIELIENIQEDIASVAIEMDQRLKGQWETNEDDEELQRRFWSLFKPSDLNQIFTLRIGTEFLRQNRDLLVPKYKRIFNNKSIPLSIGGAK
jgi:putative glycosyltransferase (TIGR04372 family)